MWASFSYLGTHSWLLIPQVCLYFYIYPSSYLGYECGYDISYILYSIPRMVVSN